MWQSALDKMLRSLVRNGVVSVVMPNGDVRTYGDGQGPTYTVRLLDDATVRTLALDPELAFGEAYMNGSLTIDGDDLQGLLGVLIRNLTASHRVWWQKAAMKLRAAFRRLTQDNVAVRSRRNVAHHYDLSGRLYDLFLDADRQYSCGYFAEGVDTLEEAQARKKEHIARKLLISPGMRVLDIGCGWGGMAMTLARDHGAHVLGVTLSEEQHAVATERAARAGLADQIEFRLCDYRDVGGTFDQIVSVGMFEHVGLPHFDAYFRAVHDRLAPEGVALIHTIGSTDVPKATNPWITKYIFPGGYIPTLSEAMASVERAGLFPADIECWRLHYAYTLRHWFDRFERNRAEVERLYGDRFVRMWRFYLAACEQAFRYGHQVVFQVQVSKRIDAVPLTRDYLYRSADRDQLKHAAE